MNHVGSCVAVYPLHSCENILEVIKQLQAVDYSDKQLSVIGVQRKRQEFWQNLRTLLKGDIFFRVPEFGSLTVVGGLSVINIMKHRDEILEDDSTALDRLLYLVGVPESSFKHYETILKMGQLMLITYGNHQEIENVGNLLELSSSVDVSLHLINTS